MVSPYCLGALGSSLFLLDLEVSELNLAGLSALFFFFTTNVHASQQQQLASRVGLPYIEIVLPTLPLAIVLLQMVPPGTFA
ncbi:hypothetical protein LY78DRAFT_663634 [Colletotrichum sublineola]|nr:hypothetical protein LY78DRAFT_663634 [Colletotrichum sublineola]